MPGRAARFSLGSVPNPRGGPLGKKRETQNLLKCTKMGILCTMAVAGVGLSFLFGLTVVTALIHEAGHAMAWTLLGAHVCEVGYARPYRPALRMTIGELTIAFNPFTVFAYTLVEDSKGRLRHFSRSQKILVHGAGIGANLLTAAFAVLLCGPIGHLFAIFSASLAIQNAFFRDGQRILSALSES